MPVSKQRKSQKKKSSARTNRLKDQAKVITKKFLENYNKIMEARNKSIESKTEE
jgi:hypothetical protein